MKTEMMLLLQTDGQPTMTLAAVAALLGIGVRTAQNRIYANTMPFPMFQVGSEWRAHVSDVARYVDKQREDATAKWSHEHHEDA